MSPDKNVVELLKAYINLDRIDEAIKHTFSKSFMLVSEYIEILKKNFGYDEKQIMNILSVCDLDMYYDYLNLRRNYGTHIHECFSNTEFKPKYEKGKTAMHYITLMRSHGENLKDCYEAYKNLHNEFQIYQSEYDKAREPFAVFDVDNILESYKF